MAPPKRELSLAELVDEVTAQYANAIGNYFNQFNRAQLNQIDHVPNDEDAAKLIVELDIRLEEATQQVNEHQKISKEIVAIEKRIKAHERWITSAIQTLAERSFELSQWTLDAKKLVGLEAKESKSPDTEMEIDGHLKRCTSTDFDINSILDFAQRISGTTSAPPGWKPGEPLGLHRPPNPQEEQIRASLLFQHRQSRDKISATSVEMKEELLTGKEEAKQKNVATTHVFGGIAAKSQSRSKDLLKMDINFSSSDDEEME